MSDSQGLGDRPTGDSVRPARPDRHLCHDRDRPRADDRPTEGCAGLSPQRPATLVGRPAGLLPGESAPEAGLGRSRSWTGSVGRLVVLLRLGSSPASTGWWRADPSRRTAPRRAGGATRRLGAGVSCFGLVCRWGNGLHAPGTLVMVRMVRLRTMPASAAALSGEGHEGSTHRAGPSSGNAEGRPTRRPIRPCGNSRWRRCRERLYPRGSVQPGDRGGGVPTSAKRGVKPGSRYAKHGLTTMKSALKTPGSRVIDSRSIGHFTRLSLGRSPTAGATIAAGFVGSTGRPVRLAAPSSTPSSSKTISVRSSRRGTPRRRAQGSREGRP